MYTVILSPPCTQLFPTSHMHTQLFLALLHMHVQLFTALFPVYTAAVVMPQTLSCCLPHSESPSRETGVQRSMHLARGVSNEASHCGAHFSFPQTQSVWDPAHRLASDCSEHQIDLTCFLLILESGTCQQGSSLPGHRLCKPVPSVLLAVVTQIPDSLSWSPL